MKPMQLHGGNILGSDVGKAGATTFRAINPATDQPLDPQFHSATEQEAGRAMELAEAAFPSYRSQPPEAIAEFLEAIAAGLEHLGNELISRAQAETALSENRLIFECGRIIFQLRTFAKLIREGSWLDVRID